LFEHFETNQFYSIIKNEKYDHFSTLLSPKTSKLGEILEGFRDKDTRIVIFVEKRTTARHIVDFINSSTSLNSFFKSGFFVGHGLKSKLEERDLMVKQNVNEQREIEKKFREGKINILVATSVAEEGLDIGACNLVIRYDQCTHVTSFIQSRGRARKQNSKFIVLHRSNDKVPSKVKDLELQEFNMGMVIKIITEGKNIWDPNIPTVSISILRKFLEDDAINILSNYTCSTAKSEPIYRIDSSGPSKKGYIASVTLPLGCAFGESIESEKRNNKDNAKKDAAYKVCIKLANMGELKAFGTKYLLREEKNNNNQNGENSGGKNPVSTLNEYFQKKFKSQVAPKFEDCDSTGPPHNPVFVVKVSFKNKELGRGSGSTKAEARMKAAQAALENKEILLSLSL